MPAGLPEKGGDAARREGRGVPKREVPAGREDTGGSGGLDLPERPDIELGARVKMRELRFREVPEHETRFFGGTEREPVAGTERENLPYGVREGEEYRDARVRLRIATRIVRGSQSPGGGGPDESGGR